MVTIVRIARGDPMVCDNLFEGMLYLVYTNAMYIAILGRQPDISIAELVSVYGREHVSQITPAIAKIDAASVDLSTLGGTIKYGQITDELPVSSHSNRSRFLAASHHIINSYSNKWQNSDRKITLGISAYNFDLPPRDIQKTGLLLKSKLKKTSASLRLIPNTETALSTATSHNNKLGLSPAKVELLIINTANSVIIAESCGAQNITAYTKRDHGKPRRDAFVGMLPPKLAQIMLNLALGGEATSPLTVLDPFCGTGTVLQEAMLRGFSVYGSDLNPKMVSYTKDNLDWIKRSHPQASGTIASLETADATNHTWQNAKQIDLVVSELYLGQPLSGLPSSEKLQQIVNNCDHIASQFLRNIHPQLSKSAKLCLALPAWQIDQGKFIQLPLISQLGSLGFERINFSQLIYHRPDQIVAREILVLTTKD